MRQQARFPDVQAPVVINVCNFAKGDPALLSFDDARTLFHEFGHALHQLLSNVTYDSMSGTSVARDFVELPSQLYEHWLTVPEILRDYATHAETGEALPQDVLDRLIGAQNFNMGFQTVEYLSSALVDLAFHDDKAPTDPMARQSEVQAALEVLRRDGQRLTAFHDLDAPVDMAARTDRVQAKASALLGDETAASLRRLIASDRARGADLATQMEV